MVLCYVVSAGLGFDDSIIGGVAFSLLILLLCFALLCFAWFGAACLIA
jgi:hypothetical protein